MRVLIPAKMTTDSRAMEQAKLLEKLTSELKALRFTLTSGFEEHYSETHDSMLFESYDSRITVRLTFPKSNPLFKYFLQVKSDHRRVIYSEVDRSYIEHLPKIVTRLRAELPLQHFSTASTQSELPSANV